MSNKIVVEEHFDNGTRYVAYGRGSLPVVGLEISWRQVIPMQKD